MELVELLVSADALPLADVVGTVAIVNHMATLCLRIDASEFLFDLHAEEVGFLVEDVSINILRLPLITLSSLSWRIRFGFSRSVVTLRRLNNLLIFHIFKFITRGKFYYWILPLYNKYLIGE